MLTNRHLILTLAFAFLALFQINQVFAFDFSESKGIRVADNMHPEKKAGKFHRDKMKHAGTGEKKGDKYVDTGEEDPKHPEKKAGKFHRDKMKHGDAESLHDSEVQGQMGDGMIDPKHPEKKKGKPHRDKMKHGGSSKN